MSVKPKVLYNTGNQEWYTPSYLIELARSVLGDIDLDPASNSVANEYIRATRFYTSEQDGLSKDWSGRVWMNPPYSARLVGLFMDKLNASYKKGDVTQAIVLVNNCTETMWFQSSASVASAVVFPGGRIKFLKADGASGSPLQGQAIFYYGPHAGTMEFLHAFSGVGFGVILPR